SRPRCLRALSGRVGAAWAAPADRARAVPRSRGREPLRGARDHSLPPVHARTVRRAAGKAVLARSARRDVLVPLTPRLGRAARTRLRRAGGGARAVGRRRRGGPRPLARGPTADARGSTARGVRRARLALARRARSRDARPRTLRRPRGARPRPVRVRTGR